MFQPILNDPTLHTQSFLCGFQGLFPPGQGATIGVDFMIKTVEIKGQKVKVGESQIAPTKVMLSNAK